MVVERKWTSEEIAKDDVSKKDIIAFLHGKFNERTSRNRLSVVFVKQLRNFSTCR